MVKSIWKGDISFGLVSIPVSLVSAEEKNDLHFHLLDAKTKSRVRYQRVNEETGKEVPWQDIVKGYEYEKGNYLIVDETAFEKASPELFKTIDIEEFVDAKDIDILYFSKPYYLIPESKNKKAYVLLREALKKSQKVGIAKVIIRTKESLSLIFPHENCLLLYLVHYKSELRTEEELNLPTDPIKNYKISDKELRMATDLIKDMTTQWEPEKYHNEYQETLHRWLEKQAAQLEKVPKKSTKVLKNKDSVIDFIALLKESMHKKNKKTARVKEKTPAKRKKS